MNQKRIAEIEKKAKQIIVDYIGDPAVIDLPVDLAAILNQSGIVLKSAVFDDPEIGGAYDKKEKIIYIAEGERPARQAFTVAHELGHYFLEHKRETEVFYRHQANEFDSKDVQDEQEANWFAASLLMPEEKVKEFYKSEKDENIIAASFGVSRSAAHWRLKNLHLI